MLEALPMRLLLRFPLQLVYKFVFRHMQSGTRTAQQYDVDAPQCSMGSIETLGSLHADDVTGTAC